MMRALRRWTAALVMIAGLAMLALLLWGWIRRNPQDVPWAPLDLGQPVGLFTGRKLTVLTQDKAQCLALLDRFFPAGNDARAGGGPTTARRSSSSG